jgi:hypothetical protein
MRGNPHILAERLYTLKHPSRSRRKDAISHRHESSSERKSTEHEQEFEISRIQSTKCSSLYTRKEVRAINLLRNLSKQHPLNTKQYSFKMEKHVYQRKLLNSPRRHKSRRVLIQLVIPDKWKNLSYTRNTGRGNSSIVRPPPQSQPELDQIRIIF